MGYAGVLARVAGEVRDADRRAIRPRAIVCGGEVLTPAMRERIRSAWRVPVFEVYASHECDLIGWECSQTGALHICEDANVVEVLAGDEPVGIGESGEVVLTSLHFYAMPFIRYEIGDVATRGDSPCGCGAPFATLREVQGRVVDYLKLADGRLLHPFQLIRAFKHAGLGWLGEFQISQPDESTIDLHFVPHAAPPPDALDRVRASLRDAVGSAVRVNVQLVQEIPRVAGGKLARRPVYDSLGADFRTAGSGAETSRGSA
jgi:phenylacetate-CoA ligase